MTTDTERFNSYVNVTDTCHLWTGKLDRDGYGLFWFNRKWMPAHAYAFGDVPPGHEIDHLCHRRNCVNRSHLEAVTHTENLARRSDRLPKANVWSSEVNEAIDETIRLGREMYEYDGEPASDQQVTAWDVSDPAATDRSSIDTTTAPAKLKTVGKPFAPGHDPRRNVNGRPPKGETFAEKYIAATERDADEVIAAHVRRSKGNTAVAARDFELIAAYHMGRPLQKFVGVQVNSPLADLIASIQEAGGMRQTDTQHNDTDHAS